MVWMAVLSYVLVWMVDLVGDTLGLPSAVTGITTSAAATSVSDLFSSLLVARKGSLQIHCFYSSTHMNTTILVRVLMRFYAALLPCTC